MDQNKILKLYHGGTVVVSKPKLLDFNRKTDFGIGFYTSSSLEQARAWTKIKQNRIGAKDGFVNVYSFDFGNISDLKVFTFQSATEEWLDFVFNNRKNNKLIHNYDVVLGPVANDTLYQTFLLFENGILNKAETISRLKTYKLVDQVSFHSNKALLNLQFIEAISINTGVK